MGLIVKRTQPSTATRESLRAALTTTLSDGDDVERVLDELVAQTPSPSKIEVDPKGFAVALRMSRGLAWYNALRLADPSSTASAREATARSVQELVDQVLHPPAWTLRVAFRVGRFVVGLFRRWPSDPELAH